MPLLFGLGNYGTGISYKYVNCTKNLGKKHWPGPTPPPSKKKYDSLEDLRRLAAFVTESGLWLDLPLNDGDRD